MVDVRSYKSFQIHTYFLRQEISLEEETIKNGSQRQRMNSVEREVCAKSRSNNDDGDGGSPEKERAEGGEEERERRPESAEKQERLFVMSHIGKIMTTSLFFLMD